MGEGSTTKFAMDHVHIKCHDINATKTFYENVFDARTIYEGKVGTAPMAMLEIGGAVVTIVETEEGEHLESPKSPRKNIWVRYGIGHFGVRVNDIDKVSRELKEKGVEFIWEPRDIRKGVRVAFIRAPDDDVIEIVQRG